MEGIAHPLTRTMPSTRQLGERKKEKEHAGTEIKQKGGNEFE